MGQSPRGGASRPPARSDLLLPGSLLRRGRTGFAFRAHAWRARVLRVGPFSVGSSRRGLRLCPLWRPLFLGRRAAKRARPSRAQLWRPTVVRPHRGGAPRTSGWRAWDTGETTTGRGRGPHLQPPRGWMSVLPGDRGSPRRDLTAMTTKRRGRRVAEGCLRVARTREGRCKERGRCVPREGRRGARAAPGTSASAARAAGLTSRGWRAARWRGASRSRCRASGCRCPCSLRR